MKKTILTAAVAAALGLSAFVAPMAVAQEGPSSAACADAKREVDRLERQLNDAKKDDRKDEERRRDNAREARNAARAEVERLEKLVSENTGNDNQAQEEKDLEAARNTLDRLERELGQAQKALDRKSNDVKGFESRLNAAKAERDKDCDEPTSTATPTPSPAPVPDGDLDCGNFPLSDGTTAQAFLERDTSDPHNIDVDNDGTACELLDDSAGEEAADTAAPVEVIVTPNGGVATGGGPA